MEMTAIICIAVVVIAIVIVLAILVYNQMLLLNEVNKRLLLMAKESVDKERQTEEELQDALKEIDELSNNITVAKETATVEQETFHDEDLD